MDRKELAVSLKLYKKCLGNTRLSVSEDKRVPVEKGQFRVLLWEPWEYILVVDMEEEGLVHAVPFTVFCDLSTSRLRLKIKDKIYAPLPFVVYLRKEIVEKESVLIKKLKDENIEVILQNVRRSPKWSANRYKREFLKLVWKRYEDLSLSSVIYTHILREQISQPEEIIVKLPQYILQKYQTQLQSFQLAAMESRALKGRNWVGVVEKNKAVLYLQEDLEGKKIRVKLFDEVLYEGIGMEKIILENLPDYPSHAYLEEYLNVEIWED
ncbi:hypothetical protein [Thermocrinis sp.]